VSVTSTNLIQGPATVYTGIFGATEPATVATTPPGAGWTDVGGTKDGVELAVADDYAVLDVDQIVYEIARRRTKRVVTIKTSLAEATLANLALAIANTAPATNVLTADDGLAAFAPAYSAIIVDGIAPGGFRRRITIRKTLPTDSVAMAYQKDGQTLVPVTWSAHWVSASIAPFKIEDATS
jgi:hypothetical protein